MVLLKVSCANCSRRSKSKIEEVDCTQEARHLLELIEKKSCNKQHSFITLLVLIDVFKGANSRKIRCDNLTSEAAYGLAKQRLVSIDKTLPEKLVNRLVIEGNPSFISMYILAPSTLLYSHFFASFFEKHLYWMQLGKCSLLRSNDVMIRRKIIIQLPLCI